MKIAIINPLERKVLPKTSGGGETWTSQFTLELTKRQTFVDLYAVKGSLDNPPLINLHILLDQGTDDITQIEFFKEKNDFDRKLTKFVATHTTKALLMIKEKEKNYDLVIDSSTNFQVSANWPLFNPPLIVIGHLPTTYTYIDYFNSFQLPPNVYFVFPSMYQFRRATNIPDKQKFFIPHGIDITDISPQLDNAGNSITWVGRILRKNNKGLREAVLACQDSDKPMNVYCYIEDQEYYQEIKNLIHKNNITFIEGESDKKLMYQHAKLFIFPTQWEEAFGLVLLEAMASGTPVVAFARGAIPEIVKDGVTGFIVNPTDDDIRGDWIVKKTGIDGLSEAIEKIYSMSKDEYRLMRQNARQHVEDNFTIQKMVDNYENIFKKILKR